MRMSVSVRQNRHRATRDWEIRVPARPQPGRLKNSTHFGLNARLPVCMQSTILNRVQLVPLLARPAPLAGVARSTLYEVYCDKQGSTNNHPPDPQIASI